LTAFTQESDKEKALAAGFDRHMGKPVELTTLVSVMRSLVPGS
jgi:CheY-like chemotaxis protein